MTAIKARLRAAFDAGWNAPKWIYCMVSKEENESSLRKQQEAAFKQFSESQVGYHGNPPLSDSEPIDTERSAKDSLLSPRSIPADVQKARNTLEATIHAYGVACHPDASINVIAAGVAFSDAIDALILACQPPHAQEIERQGTTIMEDTNPTAGDAERALVPAPREVRECLCGESPCVGASLLRAGYSCARHNPPSPPEAK